MIGLERIDADIKYDASQPILSADIQIDKKSDSKEVAQSTATKPIVRRTSLPTPWVVDARFIDYKNSDVDDTSKDYKTAAIATTAAKPSSATSTHAAFMELVTAARKFGEECKPQDVFALERMLVNKSHPMAVRYVVLADYLVKRQKYWDAITCYRVAQSWALDITGEYIFANEIQSTYALLWNKTPALHPHHPTFWQHILSNNPTNNNFNAPLDKEDETKKTNDKHCFVRLSYTLECAPHHITSIPCWNQKKLYASDLNQIYGDLTANKHFTDTKCSDFSQDIDLGHATRFFLHDPVADELPITFAANRSKLNQHASPSVEEETLKVFGEYLHQEGIVKTSTPITSENVIKGNGAMDIVGRAASVLGRHNKGITVGQHAVLVPVPTYAFATDVFNNEWLQVIMIELLPENDFRLTDKQLQTTINDTKLKLFKENIERFLFEYRWFIVKLKQLNIFEIVEQACKEQGITDLEQPLKCISPTGITISLIKENLAILTKIDAIVQKAHREHINEADFIYQNRNFNSKLVAFLPAFPQIMGLYHTNLHNPFGEDYDQHAVASLNATLLAEGVCALQDLNHKDFLFDTAKKLGSFGLCDTPCPHISIIGLSENLGPVGMRLALAYKSEDFPAANKAFSSHFVEVYKEGPLRKAFSMEAKEYDARKKFLIENNARYEFRINLLIALLEGMHAIDPTARAKVWMYIKKHGKPIHQEYLANGIPGLRLLNRPKGGFFVVLDLSPYKGFWLGTIPLVTSIDFYKALWSMFRINTLSGEAMLYTGKPIVRLTVNSPKSDFELTLLETIERLAYFVTYLTPIPDCRLPSLIDPFIDSHYIQITITQGDAFLNAHEYSLAINAYSRAIEHQLPDTLYSMYIDAYVGRAIAYLMLNSPQQTFVDCERALKLNPQLATALYWRAVANFRLGNYSESQQACESLLSRTDLDSEFIAAVTTLKDQAIRASNNSSDTNTVSVSEHSKIVIQGSELTSLSQSETLISAACAAVTSEPNETQTISSSTANAPLTMFFRNAGDANLSSSVVGCLPTTAISSLPTPPCPSK